MKKTDAEKAAPAGNGTPTPNNMRREDFTLENTPCALCAVGAPRFLLIRPVGGQDADAARQAEWIAAETAEPFALLTFRVERWNRELSPWPAPAVFGTEDFGDGAAKTLDFLEAVLLPHVRARGDLDVPAILGGYSLAGLFALWCAARSSAFSAAAAVSPSVWFPGWLAFAEAHPPHAGCVYLSLGDREEKTRNRTMAEVGRCIRAQASLLEGGGIKTVLEWNEGGHFREPDRRCARGFGWCVRSLESGEEPQKNKGLISKRR